MDELKNALDEVDDKENVVRYLLKKYFRKIGGRSPHRARIFGFTMSVA